MTTLTGFMLLSPYRGPVLTALYPTEDDAWESVCGEPDRPEYAERGFKVAPAKILIEDGKP